MSKTKTKSGSRSQTGATPAPPRRAQIPTRTLSFGTDAEAAGSRPAPAKEAPEGVAAWKTRARTLARAIDRALASPHEDPARVAAIVRACAAFDLGDSDIEAVQPVAHLVGRAFEALHEPPVSPTPSALRACSHVLYNGLPRRIREQTTFVKVEKVVAGLAGEKEAFPATVRGTAQILGWDVEALNHAAHAVRLALATKAEPVA